MVNAATGFPWWKPIFLVTQFTSASTFSYSEKSVKNLNIVTQKKRYIKCQNFKHTHVDAQWRISSISHQILYQTSSQVWHSVLPANKTLNFTEHTRWLVVERYIECRKQCTYRSFMIFTHMVTIFQFLLKKIKIPKTLDLHTEHEYTHTIASTIYLRYVGRKVFWHCFWWRI